MGEHVLDARRRALEEAFFAKHNEELRLRLGRGQADAADATGLADATVLAQLAGLGLGAEAVAALTLVPLVAVAWADGTVSDAEKDAVLAAAADGGVAAGTTAHALLEGWLAHKPPAALSEVWQAYVRALPPTGRSALHDRLLSRARAVAEASGGILGFGRKVSPAEEAVLQDLQRALG
jgi:hypothetical protein